MSMTGLGRQLQEARRGRGLTLDDAERETRIRKQHLLALEQEHFGSLPPPVYAVGFLRVYARFLEVDPAPLVAAFMEETGAKAGPQPLASSPVVDFRLSANSPRLSAFWSANLLMVSAVGAFFIFQGLRSPINAAWTAVRQTIAPQTDEVRFPPVSDLSFARSGVGSRDRGQEQAERTATGAEIASVGDAAGGGDRRPTSAEVPNVILVPPWFQPQTQSALARSQRMPSVIGRNADEARLTLEKLGLVVAAEYWWSPETPAGFVLYQHPLSTEALNRNQPAVMVVSRGPVRLTVPYLVGHSSDEALRVLRQAGLVNPPAIRYQGPKDLSPSVLSSVCNGCVVGMSPAPGTELPPEGVVTLAVRKD